MAVFDAEGGREFLGMPVLPITDHPRVEFDLIIVATLDRSGRQLADLLGAGVPRDKLFPLREGPVAPPPKRAKSQPQSRTGNGKHSS